MLALCDQYCSSFSGNVFRMYNSSGFFRLLRSNTFNPAIRPKHIQGIVMHAANTIETVKSSL